MAASASITTTSLERVQTTKRLRTSSSRAVNLAYDEGLGVIVCDDPSFPLEQAWVSVDL